MASHTIKARHQQRSDSANNWKTRNPVLMRGEIGFEDDTGKMKLGDGTTAWSGLGYLITDADYSVVSGTQPVGQSVNNTWLELLQ